MIVTKVNDDNRSTAVRLPATCIPKSYAVTLEPDLKAFTFKGQVSISVEIKSDQPLAQIVLRANEINFHNAFFVPDASNETNQVNEIVLSVNTETAVLVFDKPLRAGTGKLNITFYGTLNDKMKGFFRSKYSVANREDRYATNAQFEAVIIRDMDHLKDLHSR